MAADALRHKVVSAPIREVCLRVTVVTPVLEMIRHVQLEAIKVEKSEEQEGGWSGFIF